MSITTAEHLSAVLDGEAGEFEQCRIIDELGKSDELQEKLSTYALIGETIRDEQQQVIVSTDFLKGIHDELDEEPAYSAVLVHDASKSLRRNKGIWTKPATGFAVAASFAALAVVGIQGFVSLNSNDTTIAENDSGSRAIQTAVATSTTSSKYAYPDNKTRNLYKRYLDSHVKYASTSPMMPSIRVVSYNTSY